MQISLPPEIESLAQTAAADAGYDNVADFVVAAIRHGVSSGMINDKALERSSKSLSYSEWRERFDQFLAQRRATNPNFDDSRESIYRDRG